ncbi:hypothetical protein [Bacillus dakarensis]|nr:hypothetical protein [Bacillus dakarensis]
MLVKDQKTLIESFIEEDRFNINHYVTYLLDQSGKLNKAKNEKLPVL